MNGNVLFANAALLAQGDGLHWDDGTRVFKVLLASSTYVPRSTDIFASTVRGELSGTGYTRLALSSRSVVFDQLQARVDNYAASSTWSAINAGTAAWAVVYRHATNDADSPLICAIDLRTTSHPSGIVTSGGPLQIDWGGSEPTGRVFSAFGVMSRGGAAQLVDRAGNVKPASSIVRARGVAVANDGTGFDAGHVLVTEFPGVDPTGATDSSAGIAAADATAGDLNQRMLVPSGTYQIAADQTIVSPLDHSGGIFRPEAGKTLTVGNYQADDRAQLFDLSRSGAIKHALKARSYITPFFFGAKGTDTVDDTVAVRATFDTSRLYGCRARFLEGRYTLTSTIDLVKASGLVFEFEGHGVRTSDYAHNNSIPEWPTKFIWRGVSSANGMDLPAPTGTNPPALSFTGAPLGVFALVIRMAIAGAPGTAALQFSTDGGVNWSGNIVTPATPGTPVALTDPNLSSLVGISGLTGILVAFAAGTFSADNVWTSTSSSVFKIGGNGCHFRGGFTIHGGTSFDGSPPRPAIGLLVYKALGVGSGSHIFDDFVTWNCCYGVQSGQDKTATNCDEMVFHRYTAMLCDSGIRSMHDQMQLTHFGTANFADVGVCFDYLRGGPLVVDQFFGVWTPIMLRIGNSGQSNTGFRFGFCKFDGQQRKSPQLVVHGADPCNVIIEGGNMPNFNFGDGIPTFDIHDACAVTVRNFAGGLVHPNNRPLFRITTNDLGAQNQEPSIYLDNCNLGDVDPDVTPLGTLVGTHAHRYWQLHRCYRDGTKHMLVQNLGNMEGKRPGSVRFDPGVATLTVDHKVFGATSADNVIPTVRPTLRDDSIGRVWVSNPTTSQFTLNRSDTSGTLHVDWVAEVIPGALGVFTNLFTDPTVFTSTAWTTGGANATVIAGIDPDGFPGYSCTDTVDLVVTNHVPSSQVVNASTTGVATTVVVYAKADTLQFLNIAVDGAAIQATFDLTAHSVANSFGATSTSVSFDASTRQVRCEIVYTPTSGNKTVQFRLRKTATAQTYIGDGTGRLWLYSAEMNQ